MRLDRLLLCFVVAMAASRAGARELPLRMFTTVDGLIDDRVARIYIDSRGLLWISTSQGISRFDGARFQNFGVADGLPFASINDILELPNGDFWAASNGGGVIAFSRTARGRYAAINIGTSPATNRVNRLFRRSDGTIWAGTDGGLFRWTTSPGGVHSFQPVRLHLRDRPDQELQVWDFAEDGDATLWIGTRFGLVRLLRDGRAIVYALHPEHETDHVRDLLYTAGNHLLWIAHATGLTLFRPPPPDPAPAPAVAAVREDNTALAVPANARSNAVLAAGAMAPVAGEEVRFFGWPELNGAKTDGGRLIQAPSGAVYVVTTAGIFEFSNGRAVRMLADARLESALLSGATVDREGSIWIGFHGGGLVRLAPDGFVTFRAADGLGNIVSSVFSTHGGALVAVSRDWRISRFDGERFQSVHVNIPEAAVRAGWESTLGVVEDRAGDWWFASGAGLVRFRGVTRLDDLERLAPVVYTTRDGLSQNDIVTVFEDSRGGIWSAGLVPGRTVMSRWDRATGRFRRFSDADGLPPFNSPTSFSEDSRGAIWITLRDGGILRYDGGRFRLFTTADRLPDGGIIAAHLDRAGRLWCSSTTSGLYRLDDLGAAPLRPVFLLTAADLRGDRVARLAEDPGGGIYAITSQSMLRIETGDPGDARAAVVARYTRADGLVEGQGVDLHVDRDRRVWFAGARGLSMYQPRRRAGAAPPNIRIGSIRVAGTERPIFPAGEDELSGLELRPGESQLEIGFFGIGLATGDRLSYEHRLAGADDAWSAPSPSASVLFANLAPGRYEFQVRAVSSSGRRSERPARVAFQVLPPIWRRWWFVASSAVLMLIGLGAVERSRLAHRRAIDRAREERLVEMEHMRRRIAADLHDDIGSSLTQIAILSEVARRHGAAKIPEVADPLSNIATTSRELVDAMSDIVWAINPAKDHLYDLTRRIRRHAADVLAAANIACDIRLPPADCELKIGANVRRETFLIVKEAINNVAKHAACTEATVVLSAGAGTLRLEIHDNGRGFDPGAPTDGHGLASLRARAAALGGTLSLRSAPGAGTAVTLDLPIAT